MKIETDPITDLVVQALAASFGCGHTSTTFGPVPEVGDHAFLPIFSESETLERASRAVNPRAHDTAEWLGGLSEAEAA